MVGYLSILIILCEMKEIVGGIINKTRESKIGPWKFFHLGAKSKEENWQKPVGQVGGESRHCPGSKERQKYSEGRKGRHFQQWHII